jgi:phospholipid-binding lipoprotein MlaA
MKVRIALALALAFPACVCHAESSLDDAGDPAAAPATTFSSPETPTDELFEDMEVKEVYDPLEPINRGIFWFNDKLYFYALKPVARAYRHVPEGLRISVRNFFSNLQTPVRAVNAGLQGKLRASGTELARFLINTTLGIGGLFDPAREHFDLRMKDEDTGQTLGYYGIGPGPYLVLPFLGPSDLRDGIGEVADSGLDLTWYFWGLHKGAHNYDYLGARAADKVNDLSLDKDTYEGIKKDALDPYLFIRDAHAQYRRNQIAH